MDTATLQKLLEISAPWYVISARFDESARQVDVQIGLMHGGWFGTIRVARHPGVRRYSWRHLALGTRRVRIMLECPPGVLPPQAPWAGIEDSPFSAALSQRLLGLFVRGVSLAVASSLLDLDIEEVWLFKHRLDGGKLGAVLPAVEDAGLPLATDAPIAELPAVPAVELPQVDDRIFRGLLSGGVTLEVGHLGLQLLIARLRVQFALASDEAARSHTVSELHRYFDNNAGIVSHEIAALRSLSR